MKKNTRRIGCASSQPQQVMLLRSLLTITGDRAESDSLWIYADAGRRDAVVLDLDDARGLPPGPDARVIVALSRDPVLLMGKPFVLKKPMRSRDLAHLLDLLDAHFSSDAAAPAASTPAGALEDKHDEGVLDAIIGLARGKHADVYRLDFAGQQAYLDVPNHRIFLRQDFSFASSATCTRLDASASPHIPAAGHLVAISLADFFYEFTLASEQVGLVDGLSWQARYGIRQWPQFLRSSNTKAAIKVSAYFSRRKSSIQAAAQDLLIGMQQVIAYLNAAYAQELLVVEVDAGLAAPESPSGIAPSVAPARDASLGLFGKIRKKLGL